MSRDVLRIAVTGHRCLPEADSLKPAIQKAVERIRAAYPGRLYQVYSCLAEGADRLLGRSLVQSLPAELVVVLPLAEPEYLKDFESDESVGEYHALRRQAVAALPPARDLPRPLAYREANQILAARCDLLVAVWDGEPARGPGGTGETVELFRRAGRALLWIHAGAGPLYGTLTEERLDAL